MRQIDMHLALVQLELNPIYLTRSLDAQNASI